MIHISPWDATLGLIRGAAAILPPDHRSIPMVHTNAKGSQRPRAIKRSTGAFAIVTDLGSARPRSGRGDAQSVGFCAPAITEMPANNLSVVFRRM